MFGINLYVSLLCRNVIIYLSFYHTKNKTQNQQKLFLCARMNIDRIFYTSICFGLQIQKPTGAIGIQCETLKFQPPNGELRDRKKYSRSISRSVYSYANKCCTISTLFECFIWFSSIAYVDKLWVFPPFVYAYIHWWTLNMDSIRWRIKNILWYQRRSTMLIDHIHKTHSTHTIPTNMFSICLCITFSHSKISSG